ncbi:MAG TPA: alcohol dehydrogenase catalytic domain-containing protein, partial [Steroidobacteraceae bacterium]|nr:alcohol dehydrogenase catalytic domain-containing protein [Steroidobacteraceae bacterium]
MRARRLLGWVGFSSLALATWTSAEVRAIPDTMLAAAIDSGGGPEVLTIHRLPVPRPAAGQVLIAVRSAGVAVWDADLRRQPGTQARFPLILGSDGAGTIVAIGADVHGLQVGDAVYAARGRFYAQYALARAQDVAHLPRGVGFPQAGILPISGLSALQGIDDVLRLKAGNSLIIHGATGGVGTLAVQIA